jgi:hypothetical protein
MSSDDTDVWVKSYSYLRTAMVCLLIGLGVAVFWQVRQQGYHLLSSVSAYYYTPAQAIFVGALIGLAAAMIALKGTRPVEEVFLDLGGMFAAVVAIVPTSRGADYRTAIRACQQTAAPLLTDKTPTGMDCPTVTALEAATRANVENNMVALLVVGVLGLLAAVLFMSRSPRRAPAGDLLKAWWGVGLALLVFVATLVAFLAARTWFIEKAHYIAAIGLFVCIVVVAIVNARRQRAEQPPAGPASAAPPLEKLRRNRYASIAVALLVVAGTGIVLWWADVITLFWLEIAVAALFAVFWMVQTVEQLPEPRG